MTQTWPLHTNNRTGLKWIISFMEHLFSFETNNAFEILALLNNIRTDKPLTHTSIQTKPWIWARETRPYLDGQKLTQNRCVFDQATRKSYLCYLDGRDLPVLGEHVCQVLFTQLFAQVLDEHVGEFLRLLAPFLFTLLAWDKAADEDLKGFDVENFALVLT